MEPAYLRTGRRVRHRGAAPFHAFPAPLLPERVLSDVSGGASAPVTLRPPGEVMRLSRLGRFHPNRLSFARVLVRRMAREGWRIEPAERDLDDDGFGRIAYHVHTPNGVLGFAAFSHHLDPADRTDRVIAERWDASFALTLDPPTPADLERLQENVPLQEAGRCGAGEIVLSRANRSVRLFDEVVSSLADGGQPSLEHVGRVGYLMRTTAVYGNGKFGLADFERVQRRGILTLPFQAEMLAVYLVRHFSLDLVDHLASRRGASRAARLDRPRRRALGIGNATGLGMAPFLVNHPQLIDRWVRARETALARVLEVERADPATVARFHTLLARARTHVAEWRPHVGDAALARRLAVVARRLEELEGLVAPGTDGSFLTGPRPWAALAAWAGDDAETGELLNSIVVELHPERVDDLESATGSDEREEVRPEMPVAELRRGRRGALRLGARSGLRAARIPGPLLVPLRGEGGAAARLPLRGAGRGTRAPPRDRPPGGGSVPRTLARRRSGHAGRPVPAREPRVPADRETDPVAGGLAVRGDPRQPARRRLRAGGSPARQARDVRRKPVRPEVAALDPGDLLPGRAARRRARAPARTTGRSRRSVPAALA